MGGPVDGVTKEEVLRITGGSPLYLRELVLGGLESGALRQVDNVWRWRGELAGASRLAELVQARLCTLDEMARVTVELVAWGEPWASVSSNGWSARTRCRRPRMAACWSWSGSGRRARPARPPAVWPRCCGPPCH